MKKRHLLKLVMASMVVCATMAFAADGAGVKGNKNSKIYHKPACKHYTSKGSTEAFASEAAAKQAGFKACKRCGKTKADKKAKDTKKK
jgi:methylphosphotriester-DNA--protein-cysteine methyltransferase